MEETFQVKIISCDEPLSWYADLVGESFEVIDYNSKEFVIASDYAKRGGAWRHILKADAEFLS